MRGYFSIGFIDFILKGKTFLEYIQIYFLLVNIKRMTINNKMFSIESK